jgi:hypothetical protein
MAERAQIYRETQRKDGVVAHTQVGSLPTEHYVNYTAQTDQSKLKGTGLTRVNTYPLQRAHTRYAQPVVGVEWQEGRHLVSASLLVRDGEARLKKTDASQLVFDVSEIIARGAQKSQHANRDAYRANAATWLGASTRSLHGTERTPDIKGEVVQLVVGFEKEHAVTSSNGTTVKKRAI